MNTADAAQATFQREQTERAAIALVNVLNPLLGTVLNHDGFRRAPRLIRRSLCISLRAILTEIEATLAE